MTRVVRLSINHVDQNEIIREVCERSGMSWPEAEKFVLRVTQQNRRNIVKRQAPLLIGISIAVLVSGGLIFYFTLRLEGLLMILGGIIGFLRLWRALKQP